MKQISISQDGKYAKVEIMLKGRQKINPVLARGHFEFDAQYSLTDYWEKVNRNWVITLLTAPVSLSGSGVLKYYLPNNHGDWKKMDFVDIKSKKLQLS